MGCLLQLHPQSRKPVQPPAEDTDEKPEPIPEEAQDALRWSTGLDQMTNLVALIRNLPRAVLEEQITAWKKRDNPQTRKMEQS